MYSVFLKLMRAMAVFPQTPMQATRCSFKVKDPLFSVDTFCIYRIENTPKRCKKGLHKGFLNIGMIDLILKEYCMQ